MVWLGWIRKSCLTHQVSLILEDPEFSEFWKFPEPMYSIGAEPFAHQQMYICSYICTLLILQSGYIHTYIYFSFGVVWLFICVVQCYWVYSVFRTRSMRCSLCFVCSLAEMDLKELSDTPGGQQLAAALFATGVGWDRSGRVVCNTRWAVIGSCSVFSRDRPPRAVWYVWQAVKLLLFPYCLVLDTLIYMNASA